VLKIRVLTPRVNFSPNERTASFTHDSCYNDVCLVLARLVTSTTGQTRGLFIITWLPRVFISRRDKLVLNVHLVFIELRFRIHKREQV